jgi:hypothetical protein
MLNNQKMKHVVAGLVLAISLMAAVPALAEEFAKALYQRTVEAYPSPALKNVSGREYKFLVDDGKTKPDMDEAFVDIWKKLKSGAAANGFVMTDRKKGAKRDSGIKEYFDTKEHALWDKGYLIRLAKKDSSERVNLTVKSIHPDALRTLATPLTVTGKIKSVTEAEDNVGFGPGGQLGSYIEKGVSFSVESGALGRLMLADFGKFMPELLTLGLPAETPLLSHKVTVAQYKPGALMLPGFTPPCEVALEAWSPAEGGAPLLYDISYGYDGIDFYAEGAAHAAAEKFMTTVMQPALSSLVSADSGQWGGSKVRQLMKRPLPGK